MMESSRPSSAISVSSAPQAGSEHRESSASPATTALRGTSYATGRGLVAARGDAPPRRWTIRPGDSLWQIAENTLGDGNQWVRLWRHNRAQIPNPHQLRSGIVLTIPRPAGASASAPRTTRPRHWQVRPGDTLWEVAQKTLGNGKEWGRIWQHNRSQIPNPHDLRAGTILEIPGTTTSAGATVAPAPASQPTPVTRSDTTLASATTTASPDAAARSETAAARTTSPAPEPAKPGLAPGGPRAVGRTALEKQMAAIYNDKGRFVYDQSHALGFEPAVGAACLSVESSGSGYVAGRLIIRFESHIFRRLSGRWVGVQHTGSQAKEYDALERAKAINEMAAYESISMGAAQIMGFNAQRIGYTNAREMFQAFQASLAAQLGGFFSFVRTSKVLLKAARTRTWSTFAYHYNGPGYAANAYDSKMANAYAAYRKVTKGLPYA